MRSRNDILQDFKDDSVQSLVSGVLDEMESDVLEARNTLESISGVGDLELVDDALGTLQVLATQLY